VEPAHFVGCLFGCVQTRVVPVVHRVAPNPPERLERDGLTNEALLVARPWLREPGVDAIVKGRLVKKGRADIRGSVRLATVTTRPLSDIMRWHTPELLLNVAVHPPHTGTAVASRASQKAPPSFCGPLRRRRTADRGGG
jgi:hypothetical protein